MSDKNHCETSLMKFSNLTYYDVKNTAGSSDYRQVKGAIRNRPSSFAGWIITDKKYTMFDCEGNHRL